MAPNGRAPGPEGYATPMQEEDAYSVAQAASDQWRANE